MGYLMLIVCKEVRSMEKFNENIIQPDGWDPGVCTAVCCLSCLVTVFVPGGAVVSIYAEGSEMF